MENKYIHLAEGTSENPHMLCNALLQLMAEKSQLMEAGRPRRKGKAKIYNNSLQDITKRIEHMYNEMSPDEMAYLDKYIENAAKLLRIENARKVTNAEVDRTLEIRSVRSSKASDFLPRIAASAASTATGTVAGGIFGIWAGLRNAGDIYNKIRFKKSA